MSNHLSQVELVGEFTRDRIRDELGEYAYGAVLLDGVTVERHDRVVVNAPYELEYPRTDQVIDPQQEALF